MSDGYIGGSLVHNKALFLCAEERELVELIKRAETEHLSQLDGLLLRTICLRGWRDAAAIVIPRMPLGTLRAIDNRILWLAGESPHRDIIRLLMAAGLAVDDLRSRDNALLCQCCTIGDAKTVALLFQHELTVHDARARYNLPLRAACYGGFADIVESLIAAGLTVADVRANLYETLAVASRRGHAAVVRQLLRLGLTLQEVKTSDALQEALMAAQPSVMDEFFAKFDKGLGSHRPRVAAWRRIEAKEREQAPACAVVMAPAAIAAEERDEFIIITNDEDGDVAMDGDDVAMAGDDIDGENKAKSKGEVKGAASDEGEGDGEDDGEGESEASGGENDDGAVSDGDDGSDGDDAGVFYDTVILELQLGRAEKAKLHRGVFVEENEAMELELPDRLRAMEVAATPAAGQKET